MQPIVLVLIVFELVVMVLSISLHDCAQAWMANRLGDPTARMLGRMSMNPARHFDPFGIAIWPLLYIFRTSLILGWGAPVPMTSRNFRNPSRDEMVATLAGPVAQFAAALFALFFLILFRHLIPETTVSIEIASHLAMRNISVPLDGLPGIFPIILLLYFCIMLNLLLAVFNLIPLPFLDGGKILMHYLPYNAAKTYQSIGMYLMFGFFFFGFFIIQLFFIPLLAIFQGLLFSL